MLALVVHHEVTRPGTFSRLLVEQRQLPVPLIDGEGADGAAGFGSRLGHLGHRVEKTPVRMDGKERWIDRFTGERALGELAGSQVQFEAINAFAAGPGIGTEVDPQPFGLWILPGCSGPRTRRGVRCDQYEHKERHRGKDCQHMITHNRKDPRPWKNSVSTRYRHVISRIGYSQLPFGDQQPPDRLEFDLDGPEFFHHAQP